MTPSSTPTSGDPVAPRKNRRQKRARYLAAQEAQPSATLPQKKFYRQRAHANPFSDHQLSYPAHPSLMDWSSHFPAYVVPDIATNKNDPSGPIAPAGDETEGEIVQPTRIRPLVKPVTVADVGCGFGGLLIALSPLLPDDLILGLELRIQVTEYTVSRISALRALPPSSPSPSSSSSPPSHYQNISALRANTMKFLPNFFHQSQLSKIFLCFPDPHFKARKHKARIISPTLVAEYAYVLREGGRVYVVTDVRDLFEWFRMSFGTEAGRELFVEVKVKTNKRRKRGGVVERGEGGVNAEERGAGSDVQLGSKKVNDEEEDVDEEKGADQPEEEEPNQDPCIAIMQTCTEEGKKVSRNGGDKFVGVWRRKANPPWPGS